MKTRESIIEFIQKQKTAFVGSVDEDGFPNMKAMFTPRKIEGNCFYFSTNTSSMRAQQFMKNPKASIYVYHRGRFTGDTMYYKQGVNDPDYCVLKFTAIKGRHYCDLQTESFNIGDLE